MAHPRKNKKTRQFILLSLDLIYAVPEHSGRENRQNGDFVVKLLNMFHR